MHTTYKTLWGPKKLIGLSPNEKTTSCLIHPTYFCEDLRPFHRLLTKRSWLCSHQRVTWIAEAPTFIKQSAWNENQTLQKICHFMCSVFMFPRKAKKSNILPSSRITLAMRWNLSRVILSSFERVFHSKRCLRFRAPFSLNVQLQLGNAFLGSVRKKSPSLPS